MAILRTTVNQFVRGAAALELTPNSPTNPDLVDTYQVHLWVADQLVYDVVHSVRNWQMRHYSVEKTAQAFRCVRELLGKTIECGASDGSTNQAISSHLSMAYAHLDMDWLRIMLAATHRQRTGDLVHVHVQLRRTRTQIGEWRRTGNFGEWEDAVVARIFCTPDDAIEFGKRLSEEITQAEETRVSLGVPESDSTDEAVNIE